MSTIGCEQCGAVLSSSAEKCPKCRYPTPKNQGHCHVCNTVLSKSEHLYKRYSSNVINGTTSSSSYIQHVPCTNCGELEPLRQASGSVYQLLIVIFVLPFVLLANSQKWVRSTVPWWIRLFIGLTIIIGMIILFPKINKWLH